MTIFTRIFRLFPPAQVLRFCLVGVINTAVYLAVFYGCLLADPALYQLGNILGFVVGVACSWYLSSRFVFTASGGKPRPLQLATLLKAYACYGFTALLSALILYVLIERLGVNPYLAPLLILVIKVPLNFLLNKFWAFADRRRASSRHSSQQGSVPVSGDLS